MPDDTLEIIVIMSVGFIVGLSLDTMFNLGRKYGRRQYLRDYNELLASELDPDRSTKDVGTIRQDS